MGDMPRSPRVVPSAAHFVWALLCAAVVLSGGACGGARPTAIGTVASAIVAKPPSIPLAAPAEVLGAAALSPISLKTAKGAELPLRSLTVEGRIADPIASTELHLVFENPSDEASEARLSIALPSGASVHRLAMKRATPASSQAPAPADAWTEARELAGVSIKTNYDEALSARTDPSLFEDGAGMRFVTQIPALAPHEKRELLVEYTETIGPAAYRVHLRGLPRMDSFSASVTSLGRATPLAEVAQRGEAPSGDLEVPRARYREQPGPSAASVSSGSSFVARVTIEGERIDDPILSPIVLVDTSTSRALDIDSETATLVGFAARLPAEAELTVAAYDQSVTPLYEGKAGVFGKAQIEAIKRRRMLGASDLSGALDWAGRTSLARNGLHHRLVVFTDGLTTAGERDPAELARIAKDLEDKGIDRLDVVSIGGERNARVLGALAGEGLPSRGAIVDVARGGDEIFRRLSAKTLPPLDVAVEGASFSWPTRVSLAQAGDEVVVYGELGKRGPSTAGTASVRIGTAHTVVSLHDAPASTVMREVARAKTAASIKADAERGVVVDAGGSKAAHVTWSFGGEATPITRAVAVELAFRAGDITLTDEAPAPPNEREGIDPLDATLRTPPKVDVAATPPKIEPVPKPEKPAEAPTETAEPRVTGRLIPEVIQRVVRLNFGRFKACYVRALAQKPKLEGRVIVKFVIDSTGTPTSVVDGGSDIDFPPMQECVASAFEALSFPSPGEGSAIVTYPIAFSAHEGPLPPRRLPSPVSERPSGGTLAEPDEPFGDPYAGPFASVMKKIAAGDRPGALTEASRWQTGAAGDVLGYLALGEAAEASGDNDLAARAYGSIAELWPYRADLVRTAGMRLERVPTSDARRIARDVFRTAIALRPDHPTGYRLLAFAEARLGRSEEAFRVLERALLSNHAGGRFLAPQAILASDLGLLGAAWAHADPERKTEIDRRTRGAGGRIESEPSLRALLVWETDTTDVDLKITDGAGDLAKRGRRILPSGGELTTDMVEGYGPEAFVVRGRQEKRAYPYHLSVALPAKSALGFAPASVEVIEHDGAGKLRFEERPFVVMNDHQGIELGDISGH